ncbi:hypothetical protein [Akkermansia sp.]|uniref:hypothetical protein n=1 Tax=Akkermansia sp. TaxID=1872421 RepID=UPI0025BAAD1D|nr:hypothetical protein [Akkermansia sp.]
MKKLEKCRHFFHPGFRIHYSKRLAENRSNSTNASNLIDLKTQMSYRRTWAHSRKKATAVPACS